MLINYDKKLNKISEHKIINLFNLEPRRHIEDLRLFYFNNNICFSCSGYSPGDSKEVQICIGELHQNGDIFEMKNLNIPKDQCNWDKNWLPLIIDNNLHFIYGYNPFTIIKIHLNDYNNETFIKEDYGSKLAGFRGSAPPIEFNNGYLFIIHESIREIYVHRFIYMNKNFKIEKISEPFYFKHLGVEFCCGLTSNHKGNKLIIPFSTNDNLSALCVVKKDYVNSLLKDIN